MHNTTTEIIPALPSPSLSPTRDHSGASSDGELVAMWLEGKRSDHTRRAYAADVASLLDYLADRGKALRSATVRDVQGWASSLDGAVSSRARRIAAVKSLLSFGQQTGFLSFNVGAVVEAPKVPNQLAERILSEGEVRALFAAARGRHAILLRFLYASGARISEACALRWKQVHASPNRTATVTLHGKGGKTRHVVLPVSVASELEAMRADDEAFVFTTRTRNPLHPANVAKMVRATAKRAGIARRVSAHWFRHAHASHALDRGAPVSLVQASLGHASLATTGRYVHARPNDGAGLYLNLL